jgi:hypothetical protein
MPQPLVALQTTAPQFEDPVTLQTKAYSLRDLAAKAQAADQSRTDDQAARAAFAANPTDGAARLNALAGVSPKAYSDEAKRQADLSKADAETRAKTIETAHKQIDLAGQAFGYVRQFPTKENAVAAVNWLGQNGVLTPEHVADHLAKIDAATPEQIQGLATQAFQSAVAAKDQLAKIEVKDAGGQIVTQGTDPITGKTTTLSTLAKTQSPDNKATNDRVAAEGRANRENQIKVQTMIGDRQEPGDTAANIDPKRLAFMVDQALKGDTTVYQNLGRGKQGAANLLALRGAVADEAQKRGMTGADLAAINADYQGQKAGIRTANTISARIENAAAEAAQLAPLAIEAGRNVARSGFLPFGRAQVMFNNQTNDPALNKFATANIGLATAYAGAMARGGKATVSDNEHARELLSTAKSQEAYEAIVSQMQQEIAAARRAPNEVRSNLRNEISGKGGHGAPAAPAAAPAIPAGWSVEVH